MGRDIIRDEFSSTSFPGARETIPCPQEKQEGPSLQNCLYPSANRHEVAAQAQPEAIHDASPA